MSKPTDDFAPLRIREVVRETGDAVSLVLDVPAEYSQRYRYQAGQFLTLLVKIDGDHHRRSYSMSSSPNSGRDLQITIKRDPGGLVSNWLNDRAEAGGEIHASPPNGRFVLGEDERDIVAFAGGSGITPIYSLIGAALEGSHRRVRLFYANRDGESVIFSDALARLAEDHPGRLTVTHHFDDHSGVVTRSVISSFLAGTDSAEIYICGPGAFMDTVEDVVLGAGMPRDRVHLERFQVTNVGVADASAEQTQEVVIELDRKTTTAQYQPGNTLLQTARIAGLRAPSSCETGSCGTCMARVVAGAARMLNNDALDDDEVADGWVLTCQSLPIGGAVHVVYE